MPIERFYQPQARDGSIFGRDYTPPSQFTHAAWHVVVMLPKTSTDGLDIEIEECRMPARFFRLRARQTDETPAVTIHTGSGDEIGALLYRIAQQMAAGMLGVDVEGARDR
jgi:hypothetical protein